MSALEIFVIVAGLAGGWIVVSRLLDRSDASLEAGGDREWFEVLGIQPDAAEDEIETAYHGKRMAMLQKSPKIMTLDEQKAASASQQRIKDAYRNGKEARQVETESARL